MVLNKIGIFALVGEVVVVEGLFLWWREGDDFTVVGDMIKRPGNY